NVPAQGEDLAAFRTWVVRDGTRTLVADPGFQLATFLPPRVTLPAIILFDRRSMKAVDAFSATDTTVVRNHINATLAQLDGKPAPLPDMPALEDGIPSWIISMLSDTLPPGVPPADPSNAKADDPFAAKLGESLFEDPGFSA